MENPDNKDIIIPICILQFSNTEGIVSEDRGLDLGLSGETNMGHIMPWYKNYHQRTQVVSRTF